MVVIMILGTYDPPKTPFEVAHAGMSIPSFEYMSSDCSCNEGTPTSLFRPSSQFINDYEKKLARFIIDRDYAKPKYGWCSDKKLRPTGPHLQGVDYNFHGVARIYYSPRMMYWLTGNKKYLANLNLTPEEKKINKKYTNKRGVREPRTGPVPDNAMIIKEGFPPASDLYDQLKELIDENNPNDDSCYEDIVKELIWGWSMMVRDSRGSKDGWFWSSTAPQPRKGKLSTQEWVNENELSKYDNFMDSEFNLQCTRCHASASSQMTFSDLTNINGVDSNDLKRAGVYGNNILHFQTDVSWKDSTYLNTIGDFRIPMEKWPSEIKSCVKDSLNVAQLRELFYLPPLMRPWTDETVVGFNTFISEHLREPDPAVNLLTANPLKSFNPSFIEAFPFKHIKEVSYKNTKKFPFQWADHVVSNPAKLDHYITSDNCMGCHGGLGGSAYDVNMFIKTGPKYGEGYNISEYGEWRWSPMGLAGRDPIFFSQLESEMALLEIDYENKQLKGNSSKKMLPSEYKKLLADTKSAVTNKCLTCHGAMGERQLKKDAKTDPSLNPDFQIDYLYLTKALSKSDPMWKDPDYKYHKYGNLAREGISCTICHHINEPDAEAVKVWNPDKNKKDSLWLPEKPKEGVKELAYFLFHHNSGRYPESDSTELNGPFTDVLEKPMQDVLGITPVHNDYIKNSQMCGTCHTINLPNIGMPTSVNPILSQSYSNEAFAPYGHSIEQATFLEWQNSSFGFKPDGISPGSKFQTCQGCHMPNSFESLNGKVKIDKITTKIATIQDNSYASVGNQRPNDEIHVQPRSGFKRHEMVGLNVFLLEMFDQFPYILGVSKEDYMTSAKNGNALALENMIRQARYQTVDIAVDAIALKDSMQISVAVTNKVGHRFPSGVAFRRAFLEVLVIDSTDHNKPVVIWGSGRTNGAGVIVDEHSKPLKTEFLPNKNTYQKHHQVIRRQDQVQIYEELNLDVYGNFSTSFIHRNKSIKDNRLLPHGWRSSSNFAGTGAVIEEFMEATDPEGIGEDKDYQDAIDFAGTDNLKYIVAIPEGANPSKMAVKVTMYYQAIPPFWLHQRFKLAPEGEATQRLYYMTSHLNLDDTPMKDWKLPLVTTEVTCGQVSF